MPWNLRLSRLVARELEQHTPHWVATRMTQAVHAVFPGATIRSAFLTALAENPESVSLTHHKLVALDLYFREKEHSLKDEPIFEKPGILECLIEPRKVTFLLGAKPRIQARTHDVSRWDTRSLAEVISGALGKVGEYGGKLDSEIEDVVLRERVAQAELRNERWYDLVERDEHSLVALGSPHACLASEVMLARMFDVAPFTPPKLSFGGKGPMPFYFAWPQRLWKKPFSSFSIDWRHLHPGKLRDGLQHNRIWAFILKGKVKPVKIRAKRWTMYGIIAVQRRMGNNLWVVLSGLTGPATYAAAHLLKQLEAEIPWPTGGQHGKVLWQPYRATITDDEPPGNRGDTRELAGPPEPIGDPCFGP